LKSGNYLHAINFVQTQEETSAKNNHLGKIYYEIGNYNKAIYYYKKSLAIEPSNYIKQALAKVYKSNGNTDMAINLYSQIVEKDSLNYMVMYKLGKLFAKEKSYKEAATLFVKLNQIDPENANYLYQKALLETDLYKRANMFLEVFKLDSLHTKSMFHLANFFKIIRDKDSARLFVNKGLAIKPNSSQFLRLKINDLYKQKKYNKALMYSLHLDSISKNDVFANQRIGLCYWKLKDFKKAEEYLQIALRYDREEKTTYYYLGLFYKDIKEYKLAKLFFKQAIYHDKPDIDNEHYNLGLIAQEEKEPQKAIKHFKEAYKNNHRNYLALFELAVMSDLYYKDKSIALKHYKNYLERFKPRNKENTTYVSKRIKEIEEILFMKGKN